MREIANDPTATQQLLRVLNHDLSPSKLFTIDRLGMAAWRALVDRPRQIPATLREICSTINNEIHRAANRRKISGREAA